MSLGLAENIHRSIGVRLGLWSALIFALGCIAMLSLAYYVLAAAVGSKDREVLQARLREFAAIYIGGGLPGLQHVVQQEQGKQKTLYVRVVSPWNELIPISVPDDWITFHEIPTGVAGYRQSIGVIRVPENEEKDFVLASGILPDNS